MTEESFPAAASGKDNQVLYGLLNELRPILRTWTFPQHSERGEMLLLFTDGTSMQVSLFEEFGRLDVRVGNAPNQEDVSAWALRRSNQMLWKTRANIVDEQLQFYLLRYFRRQLFLDRLVALVIEGWEQALVYQGELNIWWSRLTPTSNSN
ncbi:hypothetical protein EHF33_12330 [Deinococcus psychrotolerans]|uniref:Uncharacterized protein n=1 Tax=Deinococcus psychrotolerans TaxID=2489213 RepID=A0A3G8YQG3_9DEIO|nr:hypothetical protein [Deinococcus psychrotolerans]AZI43436.1 hypothetical protein EHF33_12330 [Deinococcus psychrotolerans]